MRDLDWEIPPINFHKDLDARSIKPYCGKTTLQDNDLHVNQDLDVYLDLVLYFGERERERQKKSYHNNVTEGCRMEGRTNEWTNWPTDRIESGLYMQTLNSVVHSFCLNHRNVANDRFISRILLFSRVLRDSTPRFVGRSVCRSVGHILLFLFVLFLLSYFKSIKSFEVKLDHFKSF